MGTSTNSDFKISSTTLQWKQNGSVPLTRQVPRNFLKQDIMEETILGGTLNGNTKLTNNTESTNVMTAKSVESARSQRSKITRSQFWAVITKARRAFDNQLHKDNAVKLECVEHFIPTITTDAVKFWADYMDEVNVLLDSRKFGKECASLGIDPITLATHIIFLGVGMRNKVIKFGIRSAIGNDYILYKDKFVSDEAMQFVVDFEPDKREESTETAA